MRSSLYSLILAVTCGLLLSACGGGGDSNSDRVASTQNSYVQQTFVANRVTDYQPSLGADASFTDAWGIAIRPAGIPGHFWVLAGNQSFEYVGDVTGKTVAPCTTVSTLCADLAPLSSNKITIPDFPTTVVNGVATTTPDIVNNHSTGVVFNGNVSSFVITQTPTTGASITAGAKFLFATSFGTVAAWTERKKSDGTYDRPNSAVTVINGGTGAGFYGIAISPDSTKLYVADFGTQLRLRVFNSAFTEITNSLPAGAFRNPFLSSQNTADIRAGDFAPWNVQVLNGHVFVTYARLQEDPANPGMPLPTNEVHASGAGRLVEFDVDGNLIAVWNDGGLLNAPWGMAIAPSNFGALSNTLLVGNFGDYDGANKGSIVAFDMTTRKVVNYVRNPDGSPVLIPGIWGMVFGNGDTLGDSNTLYFASGPNNEADGLFGSLRYSPTR